MLNMIEMKHLNIRRRQLLFVCIKFEAKYGPSCLYIFSKYIVIHYPSGMANIAKQTEFCLHKYARHNCLQATKNTSMNAVTRFLFHLLSLSHLSKVNSVRLFKCTKYLLNFNFAHDLSSDIH